MIENDTQVHTLWKTCRVLANEQRLNLLRHLHLHQDEVWTISRLAEALGIAATTAGLYLKQMQERGLAIPIRSGRFVSYVIKANEAVAHAETLLPALLSEFGNGTDNHALIRMLTAFTHVRRPTIVAAIKSNPGTGLEQLARLTCMPIESLVRHLDKLSRRQIVVREQGYHLLSAQSALSNALLDIAVKETVCW